MRITSLLILILNTSSYYSQSTTDTIFFNTEWERITSTDSVHTYGFKDYDENGKGTGTYHYASGELHSTQQEVNNIKNGICVWYFKEGGKWFEGNYVDDEPIDTCFRYNNVDDNITYEVYVKGKLNNSFRKEENGNLLYNQCDKSPTFGKQKKPKKSNAEMYNFLGNNIVYPKKARNKGIEGRVYIKFVITKTGTSENVRVVKSAHELLDKEAVRVIELMDNWTPAKHNGVPVDYSFVIPINFRVNK